ncbi:MAG: Fic family protein [Flavisolibacter sp.]
MAKPAEKLAESLELLKEVQEKGIVAIKAEDFTRTHRERLLENGFLHEVYKGMYIMTSPHESKGSSTSWYSNFWAFCAQILEDKFGKNWCVSPEQSLILHAGNWSIPTQLIIKSPNANGYKQDLIHETSIFYMKSPLPKNAETEVLNGIRVLTLPAALIQSAANTFTQNPIDARTSLSMIRDSSELLNPLLEGGHSTVAGRLAGAFRNMGRSRIAEDIIKTMEKAGYDIREADPFQTKLIIPLSGRQHSPYVNRIKLMWQEMREKVLPHFPPAPGIPSDIKAYLQKVEKIYVTDAYHSLSIEKYKVTPELIDKVRTGNWDSIENEEDRKQRDAIAAKGYWDAFQSVEKSIERILKQENSGTVVYEDHGNWYRELFGPSVTAGLLKPSDLAGYRNHQVYIGHSKHTPLNREAIRDAMPTLFELIEKEPEASVRTILGHFIFVFIHPYMDGNGRMGRFLMNAMLASGGYPWTVIPVEKRDDYMNTLEKASVEMNIEPFAAFIGYLVSQGLKGKPVAKI